MEQSEKLELVSMIRVAMREDFMTREEMKRDYMTREEMHQTFMSREEMHQTFMTREEMTENYMSRHEISEGFPTKTDLRNEIVAAEERIDRKFGVLWEHIEEKFEMVFEAFGVVFQKLDQHDRRFEAIEAKLERKADVDEVDALDRRTTVLERRKRLA